MAGRTTTTKPAAKKVAAKINDIINAPSHYTESGEVYEPINVIEAHKLEFHEGNSVKYILRAGKKGYEGKTPEEARIIDLEKAEWYLKRKIEKLKSELKK